MHSPDRHWEPLVPFAASANLYTDSSNNTGGSVDGTALGMWEVKQRMCEEFIGELSLGKCFENI